MGRWGVRRSRGTQMAPRKDPQTPTCALEWWGQSPQHGPAATPALTLRPKWLSLCTEAQFTNLSSKLKEKETSLFFKNEKLKAIKNEGGGARQMSLDFIRSISHTDKREITKNALWLFFQRDGLCAGREESHKRYQENAITGYLCTGVSFFGDREIHSRTR